MSCNQVYDFSQINSFGEPMNTFVAFKPSALAFSEIKRGFNDFCPGFSQIFSAFEVAAPLGVAHTLQALGLPTVALD